MRVRHPARNDSETVVIRAQSLRRARALLFITTLVLPFATLPTILENDRTIYQAFKRR